VDVKAWVFDFGQNVAGFAKFVGTGAAGSSIVLKYGEVLNKDGTVDLAWGAGSGINTA
jgi:alpha-L-rhamnosidase